MLSSEPRAIHIAVANLVTLFRLVAGLSSIWIYQTPNPTVFLIIVFLFIFASDLMDGHLARRWGATTKFGAIFDYVVDRFNIYLQIAILLNIGTPVWVFVPFLIRDLVYILVQTYIAIPRVSGTKQLSLLSTATTYIFVVVSSFNSDYKMELSIFLFFSYIISLANIGYRAFLLRKNLTDELRKDFFV